VRVPSDYYDQPLEFRRACLQASSTDHLCKSIIMENTRAHPSVQGWEDPNNSKYYVVIVQVGGRGWGARSIPVPAVCCAVRWLAWACVPPDTTASVCPVAAAPADATPCTSTNQQPYCLPPLLPHVQYTARLNADKLKNHIHKLNQGRVGKQYFNMRLCPEDVSDSLSGYEHNAVSPIGIKTPLPIILSHEITKLQPDFFFLGAGEVDLKVGFSAAEFVEQYKPMVVDCTY
jgi:hypothetical protein